MILLMPFESMLNLQWFKLDLQLLLNSWFKSLSWSSIVTSNLWRILYKLILLQFFCISWLLTRIHIVTFVSRDAGILVLEKLVECWRGWNTQDWQRSLCAKNSPGLCWLLVLLSNQHLLSWIKPSRRKKPDITTESFTLCCCCFCHCFCWLKLPLLT